MDWTTDLINLMAELWQSGMPTKDMGALLRTSKNAVVGKCHRELHRGDLRFAPRPSPIIRRDGTPIARREPTQKKVVDQPPVASTIQQKPLEPQFLMIPPTRPTPPPIVTPPPSVLFKSRACCWPIGEPRKPGFRFCEAPTQRPGAVYCDAHRKDAYVRFREDNEGRVPAG